mgnify:FL=1
MRVRYLSLIFVFVLILAIFVTAQVSDANPFEKVIQRLDTIIEKIQNVIDNGLNTRVENTVDVNVVNGSLNIDEPLDVNVLSEPSKECEWEKFNHVLNGISLDPPHIGNASIIAKLPIYPFDHNYMELNFTDIKANVEVSYVNPDPNVNRTGVVRVNNYKCVEFIQNMQNDFISLENCASFLVGGINTLEAHNNCAPVHCNNPGADIGVYNITIEMKIKPANW